MGTEENQDVADEGEDLENAIPLLIACLTEL